MIIRTVFGLVQAKIIEDANKKRVLMFSSCFPDRIGDKEKQHICSLYEEEKDLHHFFHVLAGVQIDRKGRTGDFILLTDKDARFMESDFIRNEIDIALKVIVAELEEHHIERLMDEFEANQEIAKAELVIDAAQSKLFRIRDNFAAKEKEVE